MRQRTPVHAVTQVPVNVPWTLPASQTPFCTTYPSASQPSLCTTYAANVVHTACITTVILHHLQHNRHSHCLRHKCHTLTLTRQPFLDSDQARVGCETDATGDGRWPANRVPDDETEGGLDNQAARMAVPCLETMSELKLQCWMALQWTDSLFNVTASATALASRVASSESDNWTHSPAPWNDSGSCSSHKVHCTPQQ